MLFKFFLAVCTFAMLLSLHLGKLGTHMGPLHCAFQRGREEGEGGRLREQCASSLWFVPCCFFNVGVSNFSYHVAQNLTRYTCVYISLI